MDLFLLRTRWLCECFPAVFDSVVVSWTGQCTFTWSQGMHSLYHPTRHECNVYCQNQFAWEIFFHLLTVVLFIFPPHFISFLPYSQLDFSWSFFFNPESFSVSQLTMGSLKKVMKKYFETDNLYELLLITKEATQEQSKFGWSVFPFQGLCFLWRSLTLWCITFQSNKRIGKWLWKSIRIACRLIRRSWPRPNSKSSPRCTLSFPTRKNGSSTIKPVLCLNFRWK